MKTKLTLTIEDELIERAKEYVKKKGGSLSDLIEKYLKVLTTKEIREIKLSSKVKKLKGSVKLPENFDYKKDISEYLSKKYKK